MIRYWPEALDRLPFARQTNGDMIGRIAIGADCFYLCFKDGYRKLEVNPYQFAKMVNDAVALRKTQTDMFAIQYALTALGEYNIYVSLLGPYKIGGKVDLMTVNKVQLMNALLDAMRQFQRRKV